MDNKLIKIYMSLFISKFLGYTYLIYMYNLYMMIKSPSFIYFNALLTLFVMNNFGYYEQLIILTTLFISNISKNEKINIIANNISINDNPIFGKYRSKLISHVDKFNNNEIVQKLYILIDNKCDEMIKNILLYIKMKYNQKILNNDYVKQELEEFKIIKSEFEKIKNNNLNTLSNTINKEEINCNFDTLSNTINKDVINCNFDTLEIDDKQMEQIDKNLNKNLEELDTLITTLHDKKNISYNDLDEDLDEDLKVGNDKNTTNEVNLTNNSKNLEFFKTIDFNKMFSQLMEIKEKKLNIKLE